MAIVAGSANHNSPSQVTSSASTVDTARVRLHISPLNPSLLTTLLPASVLPRATGISYHSIQTFPERNYGFVELPGEEAAKLKKKLHGFILKGHKMKIEEARPKRQKLRSEGSTAQEEPLQRDESTPKRKRTEGAVPGIRLSEGRKVERGWTKPKSAERSKTKAKKGLRSETSTFTAGPECLFKTKLPANAPKTAPAGKKSKSKNDRETTVHEFTNTTKYPSFLRSGAKSTSAKVTAEYKDGVGWVDEQGEVVEKVESQRRGKKEKPTVSQPKGLEKEKPAKIQSTGKHSLRSTALVDDNYTSSSGSESEGEEDLNDKDSNTEHIALPNEDSTMKDTDTVDRSALRIDVFEPSPTKKASNAKTNKKSPNRLIDTRSSEPHPFETLFKRPAIKQESGSQDSEVKTDSVAPFSFFRTVDAEDEDAVDTYPATPHTQMELRERGWRSAAPTPDTAAIGRYFPKFPEGEDGSSEDEDQIMEDPSSEQQLDSQRRSSRTGLGIGGFDRRAFEKSFYERRGETNRAWKKRRRETSKQKRKLENKKRPKAT
jgi:hypothetical protein